MEQSDNSQRTVGEQSENSRRTVKEQSENSRRTVGEQSEVRLLAAVRSAQPVVLWLRLPLNPIMHCTRLWQADGRPHELAAVAMGMWSVFCRLRSVEVKERRGHCDGATSGWKRSCRAEPGTSQRAPRSTSTRVCGFAPATCGRCGGRDPVDPADPTAHLDQGTLPLLWTQT